MEHILVLSNFSGETEVPWFAFARGSPDASLAAEMGWVDGLRRAVQC
jgi:hypothetical protein